MKKSVFTFLLLCYLGFPVIIKAQITPFLAGRLQYTLDSVCTRYHIKGTSAAVLIPDVGIWEGVNGESEDGVPVTSDMLLGMGSNTKTHMAATLLKLQEEQMLSLDDTIGKWIQGYANISGQITIRQCLNHTSGLFDYMQNDAINDSIFGNPAKIWNREEILNLALEPNFTPGTQWDYSNTNYVIAGIIIEQVTGQSPFKVLHDKVLDPNQLSHTFNFGEEDGLLYAHPWSILMNGKSLRDMTTTPYLDNLFSLANTAGALITTAEDNVQFWHKLTSGQIVNAQSWKEMTTVTPIGNGDGYGLGIFMYSKKMNGRTIYEHGGTFFGFINENMVDTTSGVSIAVLTNQDSVSNNALLSLVVRALHKVILTMPATGIAEAAYNSNAVLVYPNPAADMIHVMVENQTNGNSYTIADITGKVVQTGLLSDEVIPVSALQPGMYFLYVRNGQQTLLHSQKIQITR